MTDEELAAAQAAAEEAAQAAKDKSTPKGKSVEARVIVAGSFGSVNDVVTVDRVVAVAHGDLDPHPDAVAYAKSLQAAKPQ